MGGRPQRFPAFPGGPGMGEAGQSGNAVLGAQPGQLLPGGAEGRESVADHHHVQQPLLEPYRKIDSDAQAEVDGCRDPSGEKDGPASLGRLLVGNPAYPADELGHHVSLHVGFIDGKEKRGPEEVQLETVQIVLGEGLGGQVEDQVSVGADGVVAGAGLHVLEAGVGMGGVTIADQPLGVLPLPLGRVEIGFCRMVLGEPGGLVQADSVAPAIVVVVHAKAQEHVQAGLVPAVAHEGQGVVPRLAQPLDGLHHPQRVAALQNRLLFTDDGVELGAVGGAAGVVDAESVHVDGRVLERPDRAFHQSLRAGRPGHAQQGVADVLKNHAIVFRPFSREGLSGPPGLFRGTGRCGPRGGTCDRGVETQGCAGQDAGSQEATARNVGIGIFLVRHASSWLNL